MLLKSWQQRLPAFNQTSLVLDPVFGLTDTNGATAYIQTGIGKNYRAVKLHEFWHRRMAHIFALPGPVGLFKHAIAHLKTI